jgi:hypothetical protein
VCATGRPWRHRRSSARLVGSAKRFVNILTAAV